jgi:hypothetical protein
MSKSRRLVVTGHTADGLSIVAAESTVNGTPVPGMPGFQVTTIWGADQRLSFPDNGKQPSHTTFFPPLEGFRFLETLIPAHAVVDQDTSAHGPTASNMKASLPGFAESMTGDRPGMHRTATVDMIYIIEGSCVLALDKGEVTLNAGDVLIQSGTNHAWLNPFDKPCRFVAVLIGAQNRP